MNHPISQTSPFALLTRVGMIVLTLGILAACGRSREAEGLPTEVAPLTETPPAATPEAPTATPQPEPTATTVPAASSEVTTTVAVTATEPVTETAAITATDSLTVSESITSAAVTEAAALTTTAPVSITAPVSETVTPHVFFRHPTDNAILPITSTVEMGAVGLLVEPAGEVKADSGHMHILVDSEWIAAGEVIPKDETHIHYGNAALTATLSLQPGLHVLRLQYADGAHTALDGDQYRDEVIVRVVDGAPEQAVRFVTPSHGATVPPTVTIVMAAAGLAVEPAGDVHENAGHLHILVDSDFVAAGEVVAKDANHLHFGKGQLSSEITLTPGLHTLRLQFADGAHRALAGEAYRDTIEVNVVEDAAASQVQIVEPQDGAEVTTTVSVKMAAAGLIIENAGPMLAEGRGHLHLLVDAEFVTAGEIVPKDDTHLHFGGGQTQATLTLSPGEHTIRLQMADGAHQALDGEQYRDEIKVTVK